MREGSISSTQTPSPLQVGTENAELARKLAIVAFVRVGVVSITLGALFIFSELRLPGAGEDVSGWQYVLIAVTYALSIVYALILRYRTAVLALAYAQIVLDTIIGTVLVTLTGGIESVFAFVFVFTVLGASITLYRRGAIIAAICYFLLFGTIVLLQVDGGLRLLSPVDFGHAMFSFFMYSVGIGLVAVLSSELSQKALITRRRLAEREIDYAELAELHAAILRSLPAGLMTMDAEGVVRFANDAALAILAQDESEVIGRLLGAVVPSMGNRWEQRRGRLAGQEVRDRYEESVKRRDGKTIRIGFSFAPLGESTNRTTGSIVVFQDVTEIVRLKDAYERAERLATVGKFAAGLAHEVRNPLASMCASIDVLKTSLSPPEPMRRLMNNVVSEADRLNVLISDFLAFARPREPQRIETDVTQLVQNVVELIRNDQLVSKVRIELQLEDGLQVSIDRDQMRQVIWNVVKNAAEAMSQSESRLSNPEAPGSAKGQQPAGRRPGMLAISTRGKKTTVEIVIRDTGPGVSAEHLKRIFDPFYTTKARGSGLGLAISYAIAQAHGGRLLLESKPGEGAEVTIILPRARGLEESQKMRLEDDRPFNTTELDLFDAATPDIGHFRTTEPS
jgi:two-component system sensor histidine kinase PilS (NtrC family)